MKRKQKLYLALALTGLYMAVIFILSIIPYEYQDIKPLLKEEVKLPVSLLPDITFYYDGMYISTSRPYDFIEFLVRKTAHVIGYFGLTLLLFFTLAFFRLPDGWRYVLSAVVTISYAALDEWNQSRIAGRTGHWEDVVFVDLLGVVLALFSVLIWKRIVTNKKKQNRKKAS